MTLALGTAACVHGLPAHQGLECSAWLNADCRLHHGAFKGFRLGMTQDEAYAAWRKGYDAGELKGGMSLQRVTAVDLGRVVVDKKYREKGFPDPERISNPTPEDLVRAKRWPLWRLEIDTDICVRIAKEGLKDPPGYVRYPTLVLGFSLGRLDYLSVECAAEM
jgi:hypothetical protein